MSESVGALEMYLYPFGLTNLFKLFSCTLYVMDHNGGWVGCFCDTCVEVDLMPSLEIHMPVGPS